MYCWINASDDPWLKTDEPYERVIQWLEPLLEALNGKADKQITNKLISECYCTYRKSIVAKSKSDSELILSLLMSILINRGLELEILSKNLTTKKLETSD